jgi:hypothetical protein
MADQDAAAAATAETRPERGCNSCTLCCKVLEVKALAKPGGKWCPHCKIGTGCTIYEQRPYDCSAFSCGYLVLAELGEEWRPAVSHLVIMDTLSEEAINVAVDPERPDAWHRQPYYASLQAWARRAIVKQRRVVVHVRNRRIVILPDHAVDLGPVATDELICVIHEGTLPGREPTYEAYAVKREVWAKVSVETWFGKSKPALSEGFRQGRRIE